MLSEIAKLFSTHCDPVSWTRFPLHHGDAKIHTQMKGKEAVENSYLDRNTEQGEQQISGGQAE